MGLLGGKQNQQICTLQEGSATKGLQLTELSILVLLLHGRIFALKSILFQAARDQSPFNSLSAMCWTSF